MNLTENQSTTFDEAALFKSVGRDVHLLRDIVRLFSETDSPRLISMLHQGLEKRDGHVVYEAGHALKGLFGEMRAAHAQSLARLIEQRGQAKDFAGLDSLILELIAETDHLKTELKHYLTAHTS